MENKEIRERVKQANNKGDFVLLLNDLVKDELGQYCAFEFSIKQINYYCNPNNVRGRYRHFTIPKKSGGKRIISAPSKGLRHLLQYVNIILKAFYVPSEYAMGFVEGRSIVDNAVRHLNQNYVFNVDLKDFFPSIVQPRVWKRLQLKPFDFPVQIANLIAGLCCMRETVDNEDGSKSYRYVLPQGAPTSPIITNMVCDNLDRRLAGLAKRFGVNFSRYADDITFSSMHNVYQPNGDFLTELNRIIAGQGFTINETKTRLQKRGSRQDVTGLTVSTKVNTSRKYIAEIRNILHIWERYGYTDAYSRFYKHYKLEKGHIKKGEPMLENVLFGKLQYLKMVKGKNDAVYKSLQSRFDCLTSPVYSNVDDGTDYLRFFTIEEFEDIIGGKIKYLLSKQGNLFGKVTVGDNSIFISITNQAKRELISKKIITDDLIVASVNALEVKEPEFSGSELYVALASKNKEIPFWQITYCNQSLYDVQLGDLSISQILDIWETDGVDAAIKAYEENIDKQFISIFDDQLSKENEMAIIDDTHKDISVDKINQENDDNVVAVL